MFSFFLQLLFVPILGSILNTVSRIILQLIIPLLLSLIFFNILTFTFGMLELKSYNFIITILKYLLSLSLFIFIFIKIIPRVYKIAESVNSTNNNISFIILFINTMNTKNTPATSLTIILLFIYTTYNVNVVSSPALAASFCKYSSTVGNISSNE